MRKILLAQGEPKDNMQILCVDHNEIERDVTVSQCRSLPQKPDVVGFGLADDALIWLENRLPDIALLEIDIPDMDGIMLAERIRIRCPEIIIIFLTSSEHFALDAYKMHAAGYLVKPVSQERLTGEIEYVLSMQKKRAAKPPSESILACTFGEFDLYVNGERVCFSRVKAKELLAYLVDKQGSSVTRANIFAALWEDAIYDRPMQKQLDVIIRSLRATLEKYSAGQILEVKNGTVRVVPERFDCDMYRFFEGDAQARITYRGEYMSSYSWASLTEAYLDRINKRF